MFWAGIFVLLAYECCLRLERLDLGAVRNGKRSSNISRTASKRKITILSCQVLG